MASATEAVVRLLDRVAQRGPLLVVLCAALAAAALLWLAQPAQAPEPVLMAPWRW
jgi:hypothetical protein